MGCFRQSFYQVNPMNQMNPKWIICFILSVRTWFPFVLYTPIYIYGLGRGQGLRFMCKEIKSSTRCHRQHYLRTPPRCLSATGSTSWGPACPCTKLNDLCHSYMTRLITCDNTGRGPSRPCLVPCPEPSQGDAKEKEKCDGRPLQLLVWWTWPSWRLH